MILIQNDENKVYLLTNSYLHFMRSSRFFFLRKIDLAPNKLLKNGQICNIVPSLTVKQAQTRMESGPEPVLLMHIAVTQTSHIQKRANLAPCMP